MQHRATLLRAIVAILFLLIYFYTYQLAARNLLPHPPWQPSSTTVYPGQVPRSGARPTSCTSYQTDPCGTLGRTTAFGHTIAPPVMTANPGDAVTGPTVPDFATPIRLKATMFMAIWRW